jgi:hypothetical protein
MSPGSKKMLHPSDGVASPQFYFPHGEGFQEASDWPSRKGRFHRSGLSSKEAALLLLRASHWGRE